VKEEALPRKPRTFDEYKDEYPHIKMERSEEGILLMQLHNGEGGEFEWSFDNHHEVGFVWRDVSADHDNKVIILTGSADAFLRREYLSVDKVDREGMDDPAKRAVEWIDAHQHGKRLEFDLLEVEQPMIAALNGPCTIHAEIPLLCDIVLAAEHTVIGDHVHFNFGLVPGDGVQVIFPLLMGLNRARYFMLTGQELSAQECLDLGLFNEVLPQADVLPRAYELARYILTHKPMVVRLFRPTLLQQVKRQMLDSVSHGLMMEGMAYAAQSPDSDIKVPRVFSDPD
jgi:enoyl-CoA hydratase/carnithine racemase